MSLWNVSEVGSCRLDSLSVPLRVLRYAERVQVGEWLSGPSTEEKKRSERQRIVVEKCPDNTPGGLFSQGEMDLLLRCRCALPRPLQLNVSQASSVFSYEIVAGPVHLGAGDFQRTITVPPRVHEQLADQEMLDELLPERRVVQVRALPVVRTRGTRHLSSDLHEPWPSKARARQCHGPPNAIFSKTAHPAGRAHRQQPEPARAVGEHPRPAVRRGRDGTRDHQNRPRTASHHSGIRRCRGFAHSPPPV